MKIKFLARLFIFVGYILGTCAIPLYYALPIFHFFLELKYTRPIESFIGLLGWSMLMWIYILLIFAIFGYAVDD